MVLHAFNCVAVICRQSEAAALHVATSMFCIVAVKGLHFLKNRYLFPIKNYTFRLALAHNLTPPISVCSVTSSLNLLRVCSQWLSVADVWRLQYSTGTNISQLHAEKRQADADAADDVSTDAMREFLSSGLRFGPQFGVIDSILLQL